MHEHNYISNLLSMYVHTYMYIHMYIRFIPIVNVRMYMFILHIYVHTYVHTYMYIRIYICTYVYVTTCITHMNLYIHAYFCNIFVGAMACKSTEDDPSLRCINTSSLCFLIDVTQPYNNELILK